MKTVTLDNMRIDAMLANPTIAAEFPFLADIRKKLEGVSRGCSSCSSRNEAAARYLTVRRIVVGLPDTAKARLKELLGTDRLMISLEAGGRIVDHIV